MTAVHGQRSRIVRSGLATLLVGLALAAGGFVTAPVQGKPASPPVSDHQISICHATGEGGYSNPSPTAAQILDTAHGHGLHLDDIIPPFPAGSQGAISWSAFLGRNWDDAGRAIYDTCSPCKTGTHDAQGNCAVTPDPEVCPEGQVGTPPSCEVVVTPDPEVCPEGQTGVWPDCVTPDPEVCAEGQTGVWPDCVTPDPEVCAVGQTGVWPDCVTPDPEVCAEGQVGTPPSCEVVVTPDPEVIPELIEPELIEPELIPAQVVEPAKQLPVEVAGIQIVGAPTHQTVVGGAELPRTGASTLGNVRLGVFLILMGAGATLAGRRRLVVTAPAPCSNPDSRGFVRTGGWLILAAAGVALLGRGRRAG